MAQAEKNGFRPPPLSSKSLSRQPSATHKKAFPGDHRCGHSYTTDQYRPTHTFSAVDGSRILSVQIVAGLMAQAEKNGFRPPPPVQQISLLPALGNTQKAFPGDHRCGHSYTTDQYRPTHTFSAVNYEMQLPPYSLQYN
ncbi:hypothetical protein CEXT_150561 [Caerostris extrusa]|uniref:Uncharacterized protein n=1 Tax=Caerostris extrusa TaxID=172846 RepID=A0AAV4QBC3_CAEEX|nr:hypothetical protein CEXT_150561 [Caerostris extrusa]